MINRLTVEIRRQNNCDISNKFVNNDERYPSQKLLNTITR